MDEIKILLDKYFEGQTSLKEEQILKSYFRKKNIPESLQSYKPMFLFFDEEIKNTKGKKEKVKFSTSVLIKKILIPVAAGLILFMGIKSLFFDQETNFQSSVYINGKKYTKSNIIQIKALDALENISAQNDEMIMSQIDILNDFNELHQ